jgi:hypothetical protein
MARDVPDPLKPANIPGQNPATPERMPGHTHYYEEKKDPDKKPNDPDEDTEDESPETNLRE